MIRSSVVAILTAALLSASVVVGAEAISPVITAAVGDPGRPAADRERDANRKPAEVVAFAGVKPGMTVAELAPGFGYYTRILAKTVGPRGKVYVMEPPGMAARPDVLDAMRNLSGVYPNVKLVMADNGRIVLPEKVDLFWTTENYHDFHNGPTANIAAFNQSVFDNLKPGGIFYVEDHRAADGAGLEATSTLHRMSLAIAKQELTAAGFKIDAEGTALANPADDRTGNNRDSGHFMSDRFMLRLKRP
jgi:predicted methyltransferase